MLLINGEVIKDINTDEAIKIVKNNIIKTLSKKLLDIEKVLNAADKLAQDVIAGKLNKDLEVFLSQDALLQYDINSIINMFKKEELPKKLSLEQGHIPTASGSGKRFTVATLGSLLHISAGNVDALPAYSVLEGLLSGNINILKLPSMDNGFSIYILKKLIEYEEVLKEYIYVFDTPSSDLETILKLMKIVNAIVVWGSDEAIEAVRKNSPTNTKIIEWGHKLSFAYIEDILVSDEKLIKLAQHIFKTKQLLCSSCQVIYINTDDFNVVKRFGKRFADILKGIEENYEISNYIKGKIAVELLTKKLESLKSTEEIYSNNNSSVICVNNTTLEVSLQFGNVLVKPLLKEKIIEELFFNKMYLQSVGIYPKNDELINILTRLGVTNISEIDKMSTFDILESHDGKFPLFEYSKIVTY